MPVTINNHKEVRSNGTSALRLLLIVEKVNSNLIFCLIHSLLRQNNNCISKRKSLQYSEGLLFSSHLLIGTRICSIKRTHDYTLRLFLCKPNLKAAFKIWYLVSPGSDEIVLHIESNDRYAAILTLVKMTKKN